MNIDIFQIAAGNYCQRINPTNTSAATALAITSYLGAPAVLAITNAGSVPVFFAFGNGSTTVVIPSAGSPANGKVILPGAEMLVASGSGATHISMITASGTGEIYLAAGLGA